MVLQTPTKMGRSRLRLPNVSDVDRFMRSGPEGVFVVVLRYYRSQPVHDKVVILVASNASRYSSGARRKHEGHVIVGVL